jgi:hypothetical protein
MGRSNPTIRKILIRRTPFRERMTNVCYPDFIKESLPLSSIVQIRKQAENDNDGRKMNLFLSKYES